MLAPPGQPYRHSRHVDHWIPAPTAPAELAAFALDHLDAAGEAYALVVLSDDTLAEAACRRDPPPPGLHWLRPEARQAMQSRTNFATWAANKGLALPPGVVCQTPEEAAGAVARWGPVMLKLDHTGAGMGVRRLADPGAAATIWGELGNPARALAQKFMPGRMGVTECVASHGQVVAWWASLKERGFRPEGPSIARRLVNPPGMARLVAGVAAATGFHGLCGFDWIWDPEGDEAPLLIEFHPRSTSGLGLGHYAGIDTSRALRALLEGGPWEPQEPLTHEALRDAPVCWYFPEHLRYALTRRPSELRYWLPGTRAASWSLVDGRDLRPVLVDLCSGLGRLRARARARRVVR